MNDPAAFSYTREHEWIDMDGKAGTIGITDHAQQSLGDIVFVELPKTGTKIEKGKVFGSVESVKSVSDLFAPVSGTVIGVNGDLATAPEKINADPYGAWLIKVELSNPEEKTGLLNAADYGKYIQEETH